MNIAEISIWANGSQTKFMLFFKKPLKTAIFVGFRRKLFDERNFSANQEVAFLV